MPTTKKFEELIKASASSGDFSSLTAAIKEAATNKKAISEDDMKGVLAVLSG